MKTLKKIGKWLKDNPWSIIVALASVFGAYLVFKSKDNKISSLHDAVEVKTAMARVAKDEARAEALINGAHGKEDEITEVDKRIAASKRRVMEIHEAKDLEGMNDDEVAVLFSDSGL